MKKLIFQSGAKHEIRGGGSGVCEKLIFQIQAKNDIYERLVKINFSKWSETEVAFVKIILSE